jgi:hypothetical protein
MEGRMTRESLQSIPMEELVALAREEGYEEGGALDRAILTEFILENLKDRAREKERENSPSVRVEDSKYQITDSRSRERPGSIIYPIPDRYNQTKLVFMVRDPHWAFAYWEMDNSTIERLSEKAENADLVLRVNETESVRPSSFDIPIQFSDSSWYIYLPEQDCSYVLELGFMEQGRYRCLASSNPVHTPRESLAWNPDSDRDLYPDFDPYSGIGGSESIPQRILAVGTE